MEKAQKLKARVKSAMIYPTFVICAAFGIVLALMKFVIPNFASVLQEMAGGAELPLLTQYVMNVSAWIATPKGMAIVLGTPISFVFLTKLIRRVRTGRFVLDTVRNHLPVIGNISSKVAVTRWTRTLGTLIGAGVPILDAIHVTSETAGNEVYSRMLDNVHNSIRQGDTFASPLQKSKTVDSIVVNMVAVGEETGDLDKMLLKVADNYDEQVDVLVGSLMSLLEPVMIIVLGAIVMTIVLAIFLPMIKVISALGSGI
jgi:type IV pilus assembly protein PilC